MKLLVKIVCIIFTSLYMTGTSTADTVTPHADKVISSRHNIRIPEIGRIKYRAHAGTLPILENDTGHREGTIFYVAYIKESTKNNVPRPITFLWNGGPGSNSSQLHFLGLGPKRPNLPSTYPEYDENTEAPVVDNHETWLAHSDLVFLDPIGTGFSRATSAEFLDKVLNVNGDAEVISEAIRVFLSRYNRWNSPLFIGGESYGTIRAEYVAEKLEQRRTHVNGVLLISGGYNGGQKVPKGLIEGLKLTEFTAIAYYHGALSVELQKNSLKDVLAEAEAWIRSEYAPAFESASTISKNMRNAIKEKLAYYTGFPLNNIDDSLKITAAMFADRLLESRGLELGRYDGRMTAPSRAKGKIWLPNIDSSLSIQADLMHGTSRVFNEYIRHTLGFESDLLYQGPFGGAFHPEELKKDPKTTLPEDWMAARFDLTGMHIPSNVEPPLVTAMRLNNSLRVLSMKGMYDGSCALLDEAVSRTAKDLKDRVSNVCLPAGHMFYTDTIARQLSVDAFAQFVRISTQFK
ncbi:MAG: hypothetical protein JKY55_20000 [Aliivibrio sp.]|uniref:S10 family serine carboxypeptidase-like protein n=1 Tax=Aliivibrio sp. TaxID=1872443 RepID=UPI001A4A6B24|nr:hypothetical protein [Aliivibrio sp.]